MMTLLVMVWDFTGAGTNVEVTDNRQLIDEEEADALIFPLNRRVLHTPIESLTDSFKERHPLVQRTSSLMVNGRDTGEDEGLDEQDMQFRLYEADFTSHQGFHENAPPSLIRQEDANGGDGTMSIYRQREMEEGALDEPICTRPTNHLLRLRLSSFYFEVMNLVGL
jgi:hypothetical protein